MSTTTTATNGKPAQRKQLSDQIDRLELELSGQIGRLDGILDALAEGLPAAVADACREGTRQAVRDVLIEVASNPELRAMLAPQTMPLPATAPGSATPPEPKKPGIWSRIKATVAEAKKAAADALTRAKEAMIRRCVIAGEAVVALGRATGEALPVRKIVLVGLGVGSVVAVACLIVPQTMAAVVGGAGAACTAMCVQVGNWLTRAARRVGVLVD